jgi:hypothetical protein
MITKERVFYPRSGRFETNRRSCWQPDYSNIYIQMFLQKLITGMDEFRISRKAFLKLLGFGFIITISGILNISRWLPLAFASNSSKDVMMPAEKNNGAQINKEYLDKFGIKKIYPTKDGGREWFINMDDPTSDGIFDQQAAEINRNPDGSWRVGFTNREEGYNGKFHIMMNVDTPKGQQEWRDVEITGHFKVASVSDQEVMNQIGLQWFARGNRHSSDVPCEGTSLKGRIHPDGKVAWIKEIWHDGGYTEEKSISKATELIEGRWIGWKSIMYNIENGNAVNMEAYLDDKCDNNWVKVTDVIDRGDWYCYDPRFDEADCHRPRNYIVTNSGPKAAFRSDGVRWDFRSLSVREIQAPGT